MRDNLSNVFPSVFPAHMGLQGNHMYPTCEMRKRCHHSPQSQPSKIASSAVLVRGSETIVSSHQACTPTRLSVAISARPAACTGSARSETEVAGSCLSGAGDSQVRTKLQASLGLASSVLRILKSGCRFGAGDSQD